MHILAQLLEPQGRFALGNIEHPGEFAVAYLFVCNQRHLIALRAVTVFDERNTCISSHLIGFHISCHISCVPASCHLGTSSQPSRDGGTLSGTCYHASIVTLPNYHLDITAVIASQDACHIETSTGDFRLVAHSLYGNLTTVDTCGYHTHIRSTADRA